MQYSRRSSSRVGGVLVLGRGGRIVFFAVGVRVGVGSARFAGFRSVLVRAFVGRGVDFLAGVGVGMTVVCTGGGAEVGVGGGGTTGVGVGVLSSTTCTAAWSPGSPPNRPIADNAQKFTPRKSISAPAPAYMALREGPPYRPTGPRTGFPLPSTQNRQPSGGGGQDGSGCQVFGGTQLRRGGDGQVGGTTNRFNASSSFRRRNPTQASGPATSPAPGRRAVSTCTYPPQRHNRCASYLRLPDRGVSRWLSPAVHAPRWRQPACARRRARPAELDEYRAGFVVPEPRRSTGRSAQQEIALATPSRNQYWRQAMFSAGSGRPTSAPCRSGRRAG